MKALLTIACMALAGAAFADNEIDAKVEAALADAARPAADQARDKNRKPLETLKFFGMQDNMRVLEIFPGGGWYTRVLAPVLDLRDSYREFRGPELWVHETDQHPNEIAHQIAADATRDFLLASLDWTEALQER